MQLDELGGLVMGVLPIDSPTKEPSKRTRKFRHIPAVEFDPSVYTASPNQHQGDKSTTERMSAASASPEPEEIVLTVKQLPHNLTKQNSCRTKQTVGTSGTRSMQGSLQGSVPGSLTSQSHHTSRRKLRPGPLRPSAGPKSRHTRKAWTNSVFVVNPEDEYSMSTYDQTSTRTPMEPVSETSKRERPFFRPPGDCPSDEDKREEASGVMDSISPSRSPWNKNLFTVDGETTTDDRSDDHVIIVESAAAESKTKIPGKHLVTSIRSAPVLESLLENVSVPFGNEMKSDASVSSCSTCSSLSMGDPTLIDLYDKKGRLRKDILIGIENGRPVMKIRTETKFIQPRNVAFKRRQPSHR